MGMSYFETSVLTFFGVNEVFENAIRAALCARRNQRFWMTNLRRVLKPSIQVGVFISRVECDHSTIVLLTSCWNEICCYGQHYCSVQVFSEPTLRLF